MDGADMRTSQFKFSSGWRKLSPRWQAPAVFVLTFMLAMPVSDFCVPRADAQANHSGIAYYYTALNVILVILAPLVFLPRTDNPSTFTLWRRIGRLPLLIRYLALIILAALLCWVGIACEQFMPPSPS